MTFTSIGLAHEPHKIILEYLVGKFVKYPSSMVAPKRERDGLFWVATTVGFVGLMGWSL